MRNGRKAGMIYKIKASRFVAGLLTQGARLHCTGDGRIDGMPGEPAPGIPEGTYSVGVAGDHMVLYPVGRD
jgi:hypothetical protein